MKALVYFDHPRPLWRIPAEVFQRMCDAIDGVDITQAKSKEEFSALLPDAEVLYAWRLNSEQLAAARRLRWFHAGSSGVGSLLFEEMVAHPCIMTNSRGCATIPVAEHAVGMMILLSRKFLDCFRFQQQRQWGRRELWDQHDEIRELSGATLGILGLGSIGLAVARRARGFDMRVIGVKRCGDEIPEGVEKVYHLEQLPKVLEASDFLVVCLPLTEATYDLLDESSFRVMKPSAFIINVGRGKIVHEPSLITALQRGQIAGAALDVFHDEPLSQESQLYELDNVFITPHVSSVSPLYWERATDIFLENLQRYRSGKALRNIVEKGAGY